MTSIWIDGRHMTIRSFGAVAKGPRGIVKLEIEVSEPGALGFLLTQIGEAKNEIDRAHAAAADAARAEKKARARKPLALPFYGCDQP